MELIERRFTLIEILVVVTVISILASLLMPALTQARSKARVANSMSNLKQIYLAGISYADSNDGTMCTPGMNLDGQDNDSTWARLFFEEIQGIHYPVKSEAEDAMNDSYYKKLFPCPYLTGVYGEFEQHGNGRSNYAMNDYFRRDYRKLSRLEGGLEPFMAAATPTATFQARPNLKYGTFNESTERHLSYAYPGVLNLALFIDGHVEQLSVSQGTAIDAAILDYDDFQ